MRAGLFFVVIAAIVALLLLPPVFTHGTCTAEFDAVAELLEHGRPEMLTLPAAQRYLDAHALAYRVISAERCESAPLRDVETCPGGPLLLGAVPVKDRICRYYRDSTVRFQLGFNTRSQLVHIQTDMNPYGIVRLPLSSVELYRGK
jgi:hypothetical protein